MKSKLTVTMVMILLVCGLTFATGEDFPKSEFNIGLSGFTYSPMSDLGLSFGASEFSFTAPGSDVSINLPNVEFGTDVSVTIGINDIETAVSHPPQSGQLLGPRVQIEYAPQPPSILVAPAYRYVPLTNPFDGLKASIAVSGENIVQVSIADIEEVIIPEPSPQVEVPAGPKYDLAGQLQDFSEQVGSSAHGFNWALKAVKPEWYEWSVMKMGTNFEFPETAPELFCSMIKTGANEDTMVGAERGRLPALQLQAWRSTPLEYPEDQPEGKPSGDLWYMKVTFRYTGIIDPLLTGHKDSKYFLALEGYKEDGTLVPIDLAPNDDSTTLELNQGTVSAGGDESWAQYVYEPIDQVCLRFEDPKSIIDPSFKIRLRKAGYGPDRFCTEVVVVNSTTTEGLPFYEYLAALEE